MKTKYILILFLICLVFGLIFLVTPNLKGNDRVGYYSYTRSVVIDKDLNFENEKLHFSQNENIVSIRKHEVTGKYFIQYPIGNSLLQLPFFSLAHFFIQGDGYSIMYVYITSLSSVVFGLLGLYLLYLVLIKYFSKKVSLLSIISIFLASNLFYYMVFESLMSHVNSFFTICLVLFIFTKNMKNMYLKYSLLGFSVALAILTRYTNIFILLIFFTTFKLNKIKYYLVSALVFFITMIPQQLLIFSKTGGLRPDYSISFYLNGLLDNPFRILFSTNHGLFLWTPILFLGFIGLFYLKQEKTKIVFMLMFLVNLIFVAALTGDYWNGSQSFSNRLFISIIPILAFGLAEIFTKFEKYFKYIVIICVGLILWNFGLIAQYGSRMIITDGSISFKEVFKNYIKIPKIIKTFITSRGEFL